MVFALREVVVVAARSVSSASNASSAEAAHTGKIDNKQNVYHTQSLSLQTYDSGSSNLESLAPR